MCYINRGARHIIHRAEQATRPVTHAAVAVVNMLPAISTITGMLLPSPRNSSVIERYAAPAALIAGRSRGVTSIPRNVNNLLNEVSTDLNIVTASAREDLDSIDRLTNHADSSLTRYDGRIREIHQDLTRVFNQTSERLEQFGAIVTHHRRQCYLNKMMKLI